MNENFANLIQISLKFVPKSPIDNMAALVQAMAWRRRGDKPLPEPMLTQISEEDESIEFILKLLTHGSYLWTLFIWRYMETDRKTNGP